MLQELYESMNAANERLDSMNDKIDMYVENVISSMNAKIYDAEFDMLYENVMNEASVKEGIKESKESLTELNKTVKEYKDAMANWKRAINNVQKSVKSGDRETVQKAIDEASKAADKAGKISFSGAVLAEKAMPALAVRKVIVNTLIVSVVGTATTLLALLQLSKHDSAMDKGSVAKTTAAVGGISVSVVGIITALQQIKKLNSNNAAPGDFSKSLIAIDKEAKKLTKLHNMVMDQALTNVKDVNPKYHRHMESAEEEFDINSYMYEEGYDISDEDFDTLMAMREAAEGGVMDSIAKAIDKIIEAFKKFYHEMKLKVLSKIVKSEFKYAVEQIKKKIKLNPFFARKKIKIANTEKQSGVIAWFQAELAKILAKLRSGKNVTPEELDDLDDEYRKRFDAASKISNAVNTTVSNAAEIASKAANKISDSIDRAFKFTNDHLKSAKDVASGAASEVASRARRVASMLSSAGKDMINVLINAVLDVVASIRSAASKLTGKEKDVEDVKEESVFTDDELDSMASEILEHSYDVDDMIASIEADIFGESGMDFDDEEESSYFEDTLDD